LREFQQIYSLGEVQLGTQVNWLGFELKVKGQGHKETKYGERSLGDMVAYKRLWGFHQIYNFGVVGTKINWLHFGISVTARANMVK